MRLPVLIAFALSVYVFAENGPPLEGTLPLTTEGDLSAQMVAGIDRWLMRETERATKSRKLEVNTPEALAKARALLRERLGMKDQTVEGPAESVLEFGREPFKSPDGKWTATPVRWPVFEGVWGEGLLLKPTGKSQAFVVAVPEAGHTPEETAGLAPSQGIENVAARKLVEAGCTVLIPAILGTNPNFSNNTQIRKWTNQTQREWIYRPAFEVGRTVIGYEAEKLLRALSAFQREGKTGIFGHGEGGLLALCAAALDERFEATVVSGYFGPHDNYWTDVISRNVFGMRREFGDAELASMIAPRTLIVEASVAGYSSSSLKMEGASPAAPGRAEAPSVDEVGREVKRANDLRQRGGNGARIVFPREKLRPPAAPGEPDVLQDLLSSLGVAGHDINRETPKQLAYDRPESAQKAREERTVRELEAHTQRILRACEAVRYQLPLWTKLKPGPEWEAVQKDARAEFWEKVIGKLPTDYLPPNVRTRQIYDEKTWRGYDVMLDVHPEIFAWGILLVPKDLKPGEHRPVVVCQHGLEGVPADTVNDDPKSPAYGPYKAFARRLVEQGFIVYAPHNPYRGGDKFRVLQRKANPLGLTLFSFIIAQHDVTTRWLASLPFVDPERIAFYGLSYGGKTAMRVPAVLDRYCLSICSGDFNEWVLKCASTEHAFSYVFTNEYEIFEWDLGHTFNYAEMALLIAPRPFMVERGHRDGVGASEWVGYEFAKVRRAYDQLGIGERAEIEWFDGPHTIHGVGTFRFLQHWLRWPEQ